MENKSKPLSPYVKIGYGVASLGDTAIYNILTVYSLFFLTDVVHIEPIIAGNIIFVTLIVNAVFIGIIGFASDRTRSRRGRRLPYMMGAVLPMGLFIMLAFTIVDLSPAVTYIYYLIVNSCIWSFHSMYIIPYEALGAELTQDAHERTILRSYARVFMSIGNLFGLVFVLYLVESFQLRGASVAESWQKVGFLVGLVSVVSCGLTCVAFQARAVSSKELARKEDRGGILSEYLQILKLKPIWYLLAATLFFTAANVFFSADIAYFMKYNMGLPEELKTVVFLVLTLSGLALTPVIGKAAGRFDKKNVMIACYIVGGVGMALIEIGGISSLFTLCVFIGVFTIGSSAYWQLIYSLLYDVSEVDELVNGVRREAIIMSTSKIFLRISTAVSTQVLGVVLFFFGYDGQSGVQSQRALWGIELSLTYIPACLLFLAAAVIFAYPISQKKHELMRRELEEQKRTR